MNTLCHLTIAELVDLLRSGDLKSERLVEAYLSRIATQNGSLAAYVTVTGEAALSAARRADKDAAAGKWHGPLHGVPIALKDVFATAGVRTTCHSRLMIDHIPDEDAESLKRLRAAGAILIGKLATHEFAFGGPSHDLPFPAARNPWNTDHVPGGSSSGSGVAVAAGLCAGALGSDTSGSIRMPAGNCGVVGLKPSYGRVSRRGLFPLSYSMDHVGPLAWTVKDCALLLQAIAGHDAADPASVKAAVPDYCEDIAKPLTGMRIGYARQWHGGMMTKDMESAMETVLTVFRGTGAEIFDLVLPPIEDLNDCGRIVLLAEGYAVHRANLSERPGDFGQFTRDRMRLGAFISADHYVQAQRMRRDLARRVLEAMHGCDVVVCANQYGPAERYTDATGTFPFFDKPYITMPFNVTGQPAMAVPCGFARNGLPLAFQIAGRPFDEVTILRVGHAFENAFGGRERRPIA